MPSTSFPARQARSHYRHELRTLTYVTLDDANGGVIRNLNHEGAAVQAVAALRSGQRVRLRFELRFPRLRVDTWGEVTWSTPTGQCGVRFVDPPRRASHQINQWIFSNLLDSLAREAAREPSIFGASIISLAGHESLPELNDGLTLSPVARPAIRLEPVPSLGGEQGVFRRPQRVEFASPDHDLVEQLNWLSRPISARAMAGLIDGLVITAGLLLFALIFLSIAHELPSWPLTLAGILAAAGLITASYWAVFTVFGGLSLGVRLAQAAAGVGLENDSDPEHRFR